jgi:hypothetical protein
VSRWQEPIDRRKGRPTLTVESPTGGVIYEFPVLGGQLANMLFTPSPRTRLVIRCERDGDITLRITERRM